MSAKTLKGHAFFSTKIRIKMEEKYFKESKLELIAFLLAHKPLVEFRGTESDGNKIFALFSPADEAEKLVNLYYSEQAVGIQPKRLFEFFNAARSIIFRERDKLKGGSE